MCILFPWSPIFPTWMGLLTEMRIAMSVCVYYSLDHLFPQHGGGCWQKWELQCLYVYIIPLITYFPNMEGVAHRNENCNVLYVYTIPLVTYFPKHGGGCSQKWELQCMYMYKIPLITYFPNMEELLTAMRIAMYICILFPWSPISPTWMGSSQKWGLQCLYVYIIPLITYFTKHGGGCSQKWELQCLYVYIIPLITYFPNMDGLLTEMRIAMYICILFPWSPIFPTWRGLLTEMRIAMSVCVYYSLDHLFPQTWRGCSQKWELQCLYVYIIPLITYFPNMEGVAERNENCNVCMCILFLWSPISTNMEGVAHRNENCNVCMCILFPWSTISPTWMGSSQKWELQCLYVYIIPLITYFPDMEGVAERNENCDVCMCILFLDHLFSRHGGGCWEKLELPMSVCVYYSLEGGHINENLQGMYGYIIPINMEGFALRNENCNGCMCILFPWSPYFPKHGGGCSHKWDLQCLYVYIIPLITYFPDMERFAERNVNCNVCVCILFLWSPISPTWRGLLTEMRNAMCMCILFPWSHISQTWRGLLTEMRIAMYV